MATLHSNSPEALSTEILADAGRECADIIQRARDEAASLLAAAKAEADKMRREQLAAAQAEATRRTEMVLATVPVEVGRRRSERIESILEGIREAARRRLLALEGDVHETVSALAIEALCRMSGTDFVLKISASDHAAYGNKLADEIGQSIGRPSLKLTISPDPIVTAGGVIVEDAEGLRIWDNRLVSRLERLWPELRRQIALQTSLISQNGTSKLCSHSNGDGNDSSENRT